MTKNRYVPFALLALTACQAPISEPSAPAIDVLAGDYVDARLQALELGVYRDASSAAAIDELNARIAKLTDQLDVLTQRLATNPSPVVDASAQATGDPVAKPAQGDGDRVVIEALRESLGVLLQQERITCENISNVNVTGYKKRQMAMTNRLDQSTGMLMSQCGAIHSIYTVGTIEITERSLDVAIDGDGFFSVVLPDGAIGYTRDGNLHIDVRGRLVTGTGYVVTPQITVPKDTLEISVDPEGRVSGRTAGSPDTQTTFGQMNIHRFINPSDLRAVGANVHRSTEASGQPTTGTPGSNGLGYVKQGFLERSNVQLHNELIDLQINRRQQAVVRRTLAEYGVFVR